MAGIQRQSKIEIIRHLNSGLPVKEPAIREVKISEMGEGTKDAYRTLRLARSDARLVGVREKRAKAKAEEATAAKK